MKRLKGAKFCKLCRRRKAIFISDGRARYDRQHDLCLRCWRSVCDSVMAMNMKEN